MTRLDDFAFPSDNFLVSIDVNIPDVTGVTGVTATLGGGSSVPLFNVGGGQWFGEECFATLANAKSALNGTWTLEITAGPSSSTSSFSYSANSLEEEDFFATPSVTNPVHGATTVDRNTTFNWTDPTGATADLLFVVVQGEEEGLLQVDNSASGSLNIGDTSWSPPSLLDVGQTEFDVFYLKGAPTLAGYFSVDSGTITWGDSPLDPSFGGEADPLSVVGSQTIIGFNVVPTADFDSNGVVDGKDFLEWQRGYDPSCTNCTFAAGDADADQDVDGDDLAVWELQYGSVVSVSTATAVIPEPTAFMLLISALSVAPLARTLRGKRGAGIKWSQDVPG